MSSKKRSQIAGRRFSATVAVAFAALMLAPTAAATPWWVAWEGNDFPENEGWERNYGNWNGYGQGQAVRTLENGLLIIDSLHDTGVYDYVQRNHASGTLDPGPGEMFIAQWRMLLETTLGAPWGVSCGFYTDGWGVGFQFSVTGVRKLFMPSVPVVSIIPGLFHDYELRSTDMRQFVLLIDGIPRLDSVFSSLPVSAPYVGWGDGILGSASLSSWDYFRYGVVPIPEPGSWLLMLVWLARSRRPRM